MRRKWTIVGAIAVLVVGAALYLWLPGSVPQGQKPLVKLSPAGVTQFEAAFDAAGNMPRLVLLLSPT